MYNLGKLAALAGLAYGGFSVKKKYDSNIKEKKTFDGSERLTKFNLGFNKNLIINFGTINISREKDLASIQSNCGSHTTVGNPTASGPNDQRQSNLHSSPSQGSNPHSSSSHDSSNSTPGHTQEMYTFQSNNVSPDEYDLTDDGMDFYTTVSNGDGTMSRE
jgi:hypothetical protein